MLEEIPRGLRLISFLETAKRLNRSRSQLYLDIDRDSSHFKPNLPLPVRIGSRVSFVEYEIDCYIRGLMLARGGGVGQ